MDQHWSAKILSRLQFATNAFGETSRISKIKVIEEHENVPAFVNVKVAKRIPLDRKSLLAAGFCRHPDTVDRNSTIGFDFIFVRIGKFFGECIRVVPTDAYGPDYIAAQSVFVDSLDIPIYEFRQQTLSQMDRPYATDAFWISFAHIEHWYGKQKERAPLILSTKPNWWKEDDESKSARASRLVEIPSACLTKPVTMLNLQCGDTIFMERAPFPLRKTADSWQNFEVGDIVEFCIDAEHGQWMLATICACEMKSDGTMILLIAVQIRGRSQSEWIEPFGNDGYRIACRGTNIYDEGVWYNRRRASEFHRSCTDIRFHSEEEAFQQAVMESLLVNGICEETPTEGDETTPSGNFPTSTGDEARDFELALALSMSMM